MIEEGQKDLPIKTLRIVCLHGFGTNNEFMSFQMRKWIKKLKHIEFIFFKSQLEVPPQLLPPPVRNSISLDKGKPDWKYAAVIESNHAQYTQNQSQYTNIDYFIDFLNEIKSADGNFNILYYKRNNDIFACFTCGSTIFLSVEIGFIKNQVEN